MKKSFIRYQNKTKFLTVFFCILSAAVFCQSNSADMSINAAGGDIGIIGASSAVPKSSYSVGQITYLYNYNANGYFCDGIQRPMEVGNIGQFGTCNDFANCGNGSSSNGSSGAVPPASNGGTGIGTNTIGSSGNNYSTNWFAPLTPQGVIVASGDSWNGNSVTPNASFTFSIGQIGYKYNTVSTLVQLNEGIQQPCYDETSSTPVATNAKYLPVRTDAEKVAAHEQIALFPNPSNGNFSLKMQSINKTDPAYIYIINLYGQIVAQYKSVNSDGFVQINISNNKLRVGTYFVRCQVGQNTNSKKLIIAK